MNTATTEGVRVSVDTLFRPDLSQTEDNRFFFNYRVTMQNLNDFDVQLLHRDWYIFDSLNEPNFVSGEGVVGEQPLIKPGERFTYSSGCELFSEIGFMKGFYTFKNHRNDQYFRVYVPLFSLIYPPKMN